MVKRRLTNPKMLVLVPLLLLLGAIALACGDDATPTPGATSPVATATSPGPTATAVPGFVLRAAEPNPTYGGTFELGHVSVVANFDFYGSTSIINRWVAGPSLNGLLRFNPLKAPFSTRIPDLATEWDISDDGLTYTFKLRPGVRFHDNALLTAEDVKATFDRIIFPPAGVLSWAESLFEGVKEVKIVDPLTVQFILSEPRAAIIELVSLEGMGISRKKTLDDNNGDLKRAFPIPGTGPYIVKSWEHGEFWKYEKNPNYWDPGLPYVDGITFRNFNWGPDTSAVFLGGRLDFAMGIDPNGFEIAQDRKEFAVGQFAAAEDQGLWFNFKRKPFDDVRVRKAFHLVVDYVGARTALEAVQPMIGRGWLMPGDPLEPDNWAKAKDQPGWRKRTSEDIAEAKKLMADAGFADGIKKVQMRGRDEPHGRLVSQLVQGWIKQHLGVEADISLDTPGILYDELIRADFDITEMGPGFATPFFWEHWGTNFVTDGSTNWGSYSNPEFDKLFAEISGTTDQAKQAELVEQMTAILDKDQPILLWGSNLITVGWKTDVKGHNMPNRSIGEPSRWDIIWLDR